MCIYLVWFFLYKDIVNLFTGGACIVNSHRFVLLIAGNSW